MMPLGLLPAVGMANSVNVPLRVTRAMLLPPYSVNHRFASGPAVMKLGVLFAVGTGNSVSAPDGVIRPMRPASSANHRLPSGPGVIPAKTLPAVGNGNSVMVPVTGAGLTLGTAGSAPIFAIFDALSSVNHILPSGPGATPPDWTSAVGTVNSAKLPAIVIRAILSCPAGASENQILPSGPARRSFGMLFAVAPAGQRSEEHTSELQSRSDLVCRLLLEKKKY